MKEYNLNILKKNLLSNYRTSLNSLVHLDLISHKEAENFILKMDTIIYLKDIAEETGLIKKNEKEFKKNNPLLIKEWEAYKKTQIENGLNLSENFFNWLLYVKKTDYKKVKDDVRGVKRIMKEEINFSMFCDRFRDMNRNDNFSYDGKKALFDYLQELEDSTGIDIDLDVISLCCEYSEYENLKEYLQNYNTAIDKEDYTDEGEFNEFEYEKAVEEEIENKTTLIRLTENVGEGFIIQCY